MSACSPMLGEFFRAEKPLMVEDLMKAYSLSRSRVNAELEVMSSDGHIEPSPFETTWRITPKGRAAWTADEGDED